MIIVQNCDMFSNLLNVIFFKEREDLENLNELASLQDQVKSVRLQDKLGKQNFHEDMKKVFEAVTKSLENTSQDITKTISEQQPSFFRYKRKRSRINE